MAVAAAARTWPDPAAMQTRRGVEEVGAREGTHRTAGEEIGRVKQEHCSSEWQANVGVCLV